MVFVSGIKSFSFGPPTLTRTFIDDARFFISFNPFFNLLSAEARLTPLTTGSASACVRLKAFFLFPTFLFYVPFNANFFIIDDEP